MRGMRTIVTGAAGGIGSALTERLVAEGAAVVAADLVEPRLPGVALSLRADVTNERQVAAVADQAEAVLGGVDGLVAAAGIHASSHTHELDLATFRRVMDVSAVGTFLMVRAVLPGMLARERGRIVTFGSTAAVCAAPELAAYAAAKGAVLQFTRSIACEYARRGVRANCVCPGGTRTAMLRAVDAERSGPDGFEEAHPIGRYAKPEEIAAAVAFLLSDESSFVLGTAFMVDGGYSCR